MNKKDDDDGAEPEFELEAEPEELMDTNAEEVDYSIAEVSEEMIEVNAGELETPEEIENQLSEADILSKLDKMWKGSNQVQSKYLLEFY